MQGHPALSTPSLPCTHPSSITSPRAPHLVCPPSTLSGLSSFPFIETDSKAAQYCRICCVRVAWFVLLMFSVSVAASGCWGDRTLSLYIFLKLYTGFFINMPVSIWASLSNIHSPHIDISSAALQRNPTFYLKGT